MTIDCGDYAHKSSQSSSTGLGNSSHRYSCTLCCRKCRPLAQEKRVQYAVRTLMQLYFVLEQALDRPSLSRFESKIFI